MNLMERDVGVRGSHLTPAISLVAAGSPWLVDYPREGDSQLDSRYNVANRKLVHPNFRSVD